ALRGWHPRPSCDEGRHPRARFFVPGNCPHAPRLQCTVTCRYLRHPDRRNDRGENRWPLTQAPIEPGELVVMTPCVVIAALTSTSTIRRRHGFLMLTRNAQLRQNIGQGTIACHRKRIVSMLRTSAKLTKFTRETLWNFNRALFFPEKHRDSELLVLVCRRGRGCILR